MSAYTDLKEKQQQEVNAFPFGFAFDQNQFTEMMKEFGLCHGWKGGKHPTRNDCKQVLSLGSGIYIKKDDRESMLRMNEKHRMEIRDAIASDTDGTGFIYEMFLAEMKDHEYGYTGDPEDVLNACGLKPEQIKNNPALSAGWKKAERRIFGTDITNIGGD